MKKYSFKNDYSEGCHPAILQALAASNMDQQPGYGDDRYSQEAMELIRGQMQFPAADIHFISGGTQANLTVIGAMLRPHESVIAANTGHINVHETGAIEATGHKVEVIRSGDGKLYPAQVKAFLGTVDAVHMTKPRMVYISNSTEAGTFYTQGELQALYECCKAHQLWLFMDGARMGSGLCAAGSDLTLPDVARYTDVFYIGGTKNGALFGEAIVICNPLLQEDFKFHLKQRGALLAKGRALGVQFRALFTNDLYFELARHANGLAAMLVAALKEAGYAMLTESTTNQVFPVLPNTIMEQLLQAFEFYPWQKIDDQNTAIRLVTSWATPESAVQAFIEKLKAVTPR